MELGLFSYLSFSLLWYVSFLTAFFCSLTPKVPLFFSRIEVFLPFLVIGVRPFLVPAGFHTPNESLLSRTPFVLVSIVKFFFYGADFPSVGVFLTFCLMSQPLRP